MATASNLYLLIYPARNMIKIGKANDVHNRIQSLRRYWGEVDYENSYWLTASQATIFKLEKTLHFLLSEYRIESEVMDGYTELFSIDALKQALKHIEHFINSGAIAVELKQGINKPALNPKQSKAYSRHLKLQKTANRIIDDVIDTAEKFKYINRLLLILLHNRNKLLYQYDIIDNVVYFRLLNVSKNHIDNSNKIARLFSFHVENYYGYGGINCCSSVVQNNILQYKIELLVEEQDIVFSWLTYLSSQAGYLLKQLPKRSSALTEDIPILDSSAIFTDMLNAIEEYNL